MVSSVDVRLENNETSFKLCSRIVLRVSDLGSCIRSVIDIVFKATIQQRSCSARDQLEEPETLIQPQAAEANPCDKDKHSTADQF